MVKLKLKNNKNGYISTVIDVLLKLFWVVPVQNYNYKSVCDAINSVLISADSESRQHFKRQSKKVFNCDFTVSMTSTGIYNFAFESDQNPAIVEQCNQTLKSHIWTYLSAKQTKKWVGALPAILNRIMKAITVASAWHPIKSLRMMRTKYEYGFTVTVTRILSNFVILKKVPIFWISSIKSVFDKGYMPNCSREQFTVRSMVHQPDNRARNFRPNYKLKDDSRKELREKWYSKKNLVDP